MTIDPASSPDPQPDRQPGAPSGAVDAATRGLDAVLGREVAMVTLPPVRGDDLLVRTERVRRLAGLHHAHLVEVFDVDGLSEDTESTLVLQSVTGRSLDPDTDRDRWPAPAVAEIGAQTASALDHAHSRGVVHGAIGTASVVVAGTDAAPFAWLTGFTAALHPSDPETPESASTAPVDPAADPATDVVALGRVLTLLTDPDRAPAAALTGTLAEMAQGRLGARAAAEALARTAETLRLADEDQTSLVPLTPAVATAEPPVASAPDLTPGVRTAVAEPSRPSRRRRLAGRSLQVAALGGAAASLAAASALVLWAGEGRSGPEPPVQVTDSGSSTPVAPQYPPVVAEPPGSGSASSSSSSSRDETVDETSSRSPITRDVTTTRPTSRPAPPLPPTVVPPTTTSVVPPPTTVPTTTTTTTTTRRPPSNNATLAAP